MCLSVWLILGPKGTEVAMCVCLSVWLILGPKGTDVAMCVLVCVADLRAYICRQHV